MPRLAHHSLLISTTVLIVASVGAQAAIPLPEHPRPDFERAEWVNLNGTWRFAFDKGARGEQAGWARSALPGTREITVPFSWGSPLSGVPDSADIGWYSRTVTHLSCLGPL